MTHVSKAVTLFLLLLVVVFMPIAAHAQFSPILQISGTVTSSTSTTPSSVISTVGYNVGYMVLSWTKTGTVSGCTMSIATSSSSTGTFATGTGTAAQTCTSNGTYRVLAPLTSTPYVEILPTVLTGTGSILYTLTLYYNSAFPSTLNLASDPGIQAHALYCAGSPTADAFDIYNSAGTLQWGVNCSGQTTASQGQTTVGAGSPAIVYNTAPAAGTASISATTMVTPAAAGTYRFSAYNTQTVVGASCAGNTTVQVAIVYQDANAASAQTVNTALYTVTTNGTIGVVPWTSGRESVTFRAKAAVAIQFQTTYSLGGSCSPGPTVQIMPVLEYLSN